MDAVITYVNALFTVFIIIIFLRLLLSWVEAFNRSVPGGAPAYAVVGFVRSSTDWFLNFFRRLIPPLGMFDLSPIVALLVLYILRGLITGILGSF